LRLLGGDVGLSRTPNRRVPFGEKAGIGFDAVLAVPLDSFCFICAPFNGDG